MSHVLPILCDEEVSQTVPVDDEAGFGALATERGPLPLKTMDVRTRIDGLLAHTTISQRFVNTHSQALEATYIFPLPDRAAVIRFRMEVCGRVIEGTLKERGQARQDYEQAIQAGHRAALAEEERPNVLTLRVGNLMPDEEASVQLSLVGPLPYSDGEATFRFPLVVAPRYIPGTPLPGPSVGAGTALDTNAVPDASRITPPVLLPGYPNPVHLSLAVDIQPSPMQLRDFRSSLHTILNEEDREGLRRIALQPGERLNRDFILRFRLGEQSIRSSLTLSPDADKKNEGGTYALTVLPPMGTANRQRPRDVVFVLDRSGSMGGWKMVAARRALARMVDTLTDQDRFNVYAFDNAIQTPPEFGGNGLQRASDRNRFRAVEFLAKIEARGGTEMAQPLELAVTHLLQGNPERERILVLITDGQVGNEDQILRSLGNRARELRIFTLGIDRAVNEAFLKRLATLGGGSYELVESEDRLDEVMDKVHRRIGPPVLTGLRLEPAGLRLAADGTVPDRMPDLFAGAPLVLMGRYHGPAHGSVTLQATSAVGRTWSETVASRVSDNPAIACVWARGHIRRLEDRFVVGQGDRSKLEKQIVDTSLKFGVLCRFTAFVAVDKSEVVNKGGQGHRIVQPVEAPQGWGMLETRSVGAMPAMPSLRRAAPPPACAAAPACPPPAEGAGGLTERLSTLGKRRKEEAGSRDREGGILRRLFGAMGQGSRAADAAAAEDLSAYRPRARMLLERLKSCTATEPAARLSELGILLVQLQALLEDMRSVAITGQAVEPLQQLVVDLRQLVAQDQPTPAEVDQVWSQAEMVLGTFVGDVQKRGEFWK
jgi:Ca-activated chloride channel family protein